MRTAVKLKGELSSPFLFNNSVKQGCVLAPNLFIIFLSGALYHAFNDYKHRCVDSEQAWSRFFQCQPVQVCNKTRSILVQELMFAHDTAFVAHNYDNFYEIVSKFPRFLQAFGLKININKWRCCINQFPGIMLGASLYTSKTIS